MANTWATVYWQLGDTPQQLRRTVAMPDETVGTLMRRALEEASIMGLISEEDAFSKDVLENWQAYVQFQGTEQPLSHEERLDDRLPRQGGQLLFRPSTTTHLRAAPLRLSLDGITYKPPAPPKSNRLFTWILIGVMLLLLGAVSVLLWQRLNKPKPAPDKAPAAGRIDASAPDAGSADAKGDAGTPGAAGKLTPDAGTADAGALTPDGTRADGGADGGAGADALPDVAPRPARPRPRKARHRRRRRRLKRKRRRRRTRRRRKRSKRSKRSTRRKRRTKKKRKNKRSKNKRKPPPRR